MVRFILPVFLDHERTSTYSSEPHPFNMLHGSPYGFHFKCVLTFGEKQAGIAPPGEHLPTLGARQDG